MSSWGRRMSASVRPERVDGANRDILDRPGGVDADQLALGPVVVDPGRGLLRVLHEPGGDRLGLVVVPLEQLRPAPVADVLLARRVELDVPDLPAAPARTPSRQ